MTEVTRRDFLRQSALAGALSLLAANSSAAAPRRAPEPSAKGGKGIAPHVIARIADCGRYEALNPLFKKAFAFLRRKDLAELKVGRYEIDGDNCWAMVQEAKLTPLKDVAQVEAHRAYIDIQAPISGPETFGLLTMTARERALPFNGEKDYVLFDAPTRPVTVRPGEFAIFFPPDGAHAPCHTDGGNRTIRKLVIKVRGQRPVRPHDGL